MTRRAALAAVALLVSIGLLAGQLRRALADPGFWPPDDYVEYWAAGRLNLDGENPYDAARVYALQQDIGWDSGQAIMMWNPPWALSLAMPLGALDWRAGQFLWLVVKIAALGYCTARLWTLFRGPADKAWVAWAVAFSFLPTLISLRTGQISPFLLLGAVLFLDQERRGRGFWAGAACVLLALKPHLAYLVWLAVGVEAVTRRRVSVVLGGVAGGVLLSVWPVLVNPAVFDQYFAAMRDNPPSQWMSLTAGTLLRLVFGPEKFWLQFVPMAVGLVWFAGYWWRHCADWVWVERLPWLLFVSFVTAPYGAWPFDLVLLLVPLLWLAARLCERGNEAARVPAVAGYVAVSLGMLGVNVAELYATWFIWVAPVLLALAVLLRRRLVTPSAVPA